MRTALVAAVAANGIIGADGRMPWHLPEDLAQFRRRTVGHPVVMGRTTFETVRRQVGGALPDRTNVVLTSRPETLPTEEAVVGVDSVTTAVQAARETGSETCYVAGGASVYEQFLPRADRLVLSELYESYAGDTEFPDRDSERWRAVEREAYDAFELVTYERAGT